MYLARLGTEVAVADWFDRSKNRPCQTLKTVGSSNKSEKPSHLCCIGALSRGLHYSSTGCPAKTVNRHKGGVVLLKEPELIYEIVSEVRQAVSPGVPVTAKMRLGYLDSELAIDNAKAIESAGASALAIHARTKLQGYHPPAHWHELAIIREVVKIPITANGDIMVGRGVLRNPELPSAIASSEKNPCPDYRWQRRLDILKRFTHKVIQPTEPGQEHPYLINNPKRYLDGRLKQWLSMMSQSSSRAMELFERIKTETNLQAIGQIMQEAQ